MLEKKAKDRIIEKFKTHQTDTGSSEVQIAILTYEIQDLIKHLKDHRKDFSSRRGLIKKVYQRRRLLRFLERDNSESHQNIIARLKLKKRVPLGKTVEEDIAEEAAVEVATNQGQ